MKALIMTDGRINELHPLTSFVPKAMLPLMQKPMVEYMLTWLKKQGIKEIVISGYERLSHIENYYGNGNEVGCKITYVHLQPEANAKQFIEQLDQHLDETFLCINGIYVTNVDLKLARQLHKNKKSPCTILTKDSLRSKAHTLIVDDSGYVSLYEKKKGINGRPSIDTGIYIVEPHALEFVHTFVMKGLFSIESPVIGCYVDGYWRRIHKMDDYRKAQEDMMFGQSDQVV